VLNAADSSSISGDSVINDVDYRSLFDETIMAPDRNATIVSIGDDSDLAARERRRQFVLNELLHTERVYAADLRICINTYLNSFVDPQMSKMVPIELRANEKIIFSNINQIYSFHQE
jgi:hypothetical protein